MNLVAWAIAAYVVLQMIIGYVASRRVRTETDYLLAGRRLGLPLVTLSVFSTWFGAEACIGSAGAVHRSGLSGSIAEPFGYTLCLVIAGTFYAARLRAGNYTTLADLFRERFSPGAEKFAALVMVPTSVLWAGAQVRAFGQVLDHATGIGLTAAIALAAGVAVFYTVLGGLYADAVTDMVQAIVLIVGLVVLSVLVFSRLGGLDALAAVPAARLSLIPAAASKSEVVEAWAVPVIGSLFAQELAARAMAARTPSVARRGTLLAAGLYFCVGLLPVILGLVGGGTLTSLEHPEQLLPALAEQHLSTVAYVIFVGALVSAILSTVDSTLLVSASMVSHNLLPALWPEQSEASKVRSARWMVVISGALALLLALSAESVVELVEQSSAFGGAGVFVAGTFGLLGLRGGPKTAMATLVIGASSYLIAGPMLGLSAPFTTSLLASLLTWLAFARRPATAT
ncbi:MAG: sodium:solute symporter family protein [Polyangiaceae bacterium]